MGAQPGAAGTARRQDAGGAKPDPLRRRPAAPAAAPRARRLLVPGPASRGSGRSAACPSRQAPQPLQRRPPIMPECRRVAYAVTIPRLQQLDHAPVNEAKRWQVAGRPARGAPVEPGPERVLVAVAEPGPQQVAAAPAPASAARCRASSPAPDRVAVRQHHRAPRRVPPGEVHGDQGTRVPPVDHSQADPQCRDRVGERVGIVLDLRGAPSARGSDSP